MIETIILCTIFGVFILISYTLGLRQGQKLKNNEEIKLPVLNPIKIVNNEIERFEEKKKQEAYEITISNIDTYDGTGLGQRDIPS